jgi:hypothetical protein
MARTDQKWQLHLEDRLDLIRYAPRDRALEILHLLLEAVYGEGYIRGAEGIKDRVTKIPITTDERLAARQSARDDDQADRLTGSSFLD